jgi:hypothetical protein
MRYLWSLACAIALGVLIPHQAGAQEPAPPDSEQVKEKARALADRGYELYQAGQYAEALEAFREAERDYHAPTVLLMVARTHDRLGRLLDARSTYQSILAEEIDSSAPDVFRQAQEDARVELAALTRRIPTLQVVITGVPTTDVELTIDGAPAPTSGAPLPKQPGTSTIVASASGRPPIKHVITLHEGQAEHLMLAFSPPSAPSERGSFVPATIAFGAAGMGLGAGVITGVLAKIQADDVKSRCTDDNHCLQADEPKAEQAQALQTVSIASFVAGGVAAAAGVTLLILRPGADASASTKKTGVRIVVGPGSAHFVGRF